MSDPFEPPAAEADPAEPAPLASPLEDPHLVILAVLLLLYGLPMCGFAGLFPPVGFIGGLIDPDFSDVPGGFLFTGCIGTLEGLCIGLIGAMYVGGGVGLFMGRKWGWGLALAGSGLFMSSPCCLPVGAYGLFALLRVRARTLYGF